MITKNIFKAEKAETKYEKLPIIIKYLESLKADEVKRLAFSLPKEGFRENDIIDYFFNESQRSHI